MGLVGQMVEFGYLEHFILHVVNVNYTLDCFFSGLVV